MAGQLRLDIIRGKNNFRSCGSKDKRGCWRKLDGIGKRGGIPKISKSKTPGSLSKREEEKGRNIVQKGIKSPDQKSGDMLNHQLGIKGDLKKARTAHRLWEKDNNLRQVRPTVMGACKGNNEKGLLFCSNVGGGSLANTQRCWEKKLIKARRLKPSQGTTFA